MEKAKTFLDIEIYGSVYTLKSYLAKSMGFLKESGGLVRDLYGVRELGGAVRHDHEDQGFIDFFKDSAGRLVYAYQPLGGQNGAKWDIEWFENNNIVVPEVYDEVRLVEDVKGTVYKVLKDATLTDGLRALIELRQGWMDAKYS